MDGINGGRPEWYGEAKRQAAGRTTDSVFTAEMKRSVFRSIDKLEKGGGRLRKKGWATLAVCLAAGLALLWLQDHRLEPGETAKPHMAASGLLGEIPTTIREGELAVVYKQMEGKKLKKEDTVKNSEPELLPGLGNSYHPIATPGRMAIDTLMYNDIEWIDSKKMEGVGTLLKYKITNADKRPWIRSGDYEWFGFTVDDYTGPDVIYNWGMGHSYEFSHEVVRLFGIDMLKLSVQSNIDGVGVSTWYIRKQEGGLETYLSFAYPDMHERDLDGDGIEELIAVSGKGNQIYVFKERNNELYYASIRELLGADDGVAVGYNRHTGVFSVTGTSGGGQALYQYAEGADKLVPLVP